VTSQLSSEEIAACFDAKRHFQHLDEVYKRLDI
jgi:hypothetical protein